MSETLDAMIYRFGHYELDAQRFELRCEGRLVPLAARPFDLLLALIRRRDALVTKDEIMTEVWRGVLVTKDSLPQTMMTVRRALDDDSEHPQFIVTVRGRGYRFVADVTEIESSGAASEPTPRRDAGPGLIGRGEPLGALRDTVAQARLGRGRVVFLTGEAGLGKTQLIAELCATSEASLLPLVVSCRAREGAPEPWAFVQLVRELEDLDVALDDELSSFAANGIGSSDDSKTRFRLLDRVASTLASFAADRPLLIVLDDLHQASSTTLALLDLLVRRVRGAPIVLLCAHRPGASSDPAFESAVFALTREPFASVIRLAPFTKEESALFIERAIGRAPARSLLDRLFEKTKGNPSFLAELVHILRKEQDLKAEVGTSALVGGDGMREAIAHLLTSLPERVRSVLTMAAVFGGAVPLAPLASALGMSNATVLEDLDAACAVRVLERVEQGVYRFTYLLVRDVLHKHLSASERARLHSVVADVLIRHVGTSDAHERVGEVARHLVESAAAGDVDRAVDWSLRAAVLAENAGAQSVAKEYAERGLRALRFASVPDAEREQRLRVFIR